MHSLNVIIFTCWIIFWLYWLIAALGSKRNTRSRIRQFVGARIVIFVVLVLIINSTTHNGNFKNYYLANNNQALQIIGVILFLIGLLLAIWARIYLGKNWGMPMSEKEEPELVTTGPYRYIRHPIYTGILLAVVGSIIAGSIYWLIMLVFTAPYFIYSAVVEEKIMMKEFPKVYPSYKNKTKMLIPFIF